VITWIVIEAFQLVLLVVCGTVYIRRSRRGLSSAGRLKYRSALIGLIAWCLLTAAKIALKAPA